MDDGLPVLRGFDEALRFGIILEAVALRRTYPELKAKSGGGIDEAR